MSHGGESNSQSLVKDVAPVPHRAHLWSHASEIGHYRPMDAVSHVNTKTDACRGLVMSTL